MTKVELEACPHIERVPAHDEFGDETGAFWFVLTCGECGTPSRRFETEAQAIAAWNTRTPEYGRVHTDGSRSGGQRPNDARLADEIELAALIFAANESETLDEARANLPRWRENIRRGITAEHSGDCTKECHMCDRCLAEDFVNQAHILAALRTPCEYGRKHTDGSRSGGQRPNDAGLGAIAALEKAAETFSHYAEIHAAKNTPEAYKKANANARLAGEMYGAIGRLRTPAGDDAGLVELARQLRSYCTPTPFWHNEEGWQTIIKMVFSKAAALKETPAMPKVEQIDRDAAAPLFRLYGAENYAVLCEKGSELVDRLGLVQALAAHRLAERERLATVTPGMIEAALHARVPGGSEVWVWLPQQDAFTPAPVAREVMQIAITAALAMLKGSTDAE